jgi:hypothetical protein
MLDTLRISAVRSLRAAFLFWFCALAIGAVAPPPATAGESDGRCVVWFRMKSDEAVSSINFDVFYPGADGSFEGEGSGVVCDIAISGSTLQAFRDHDIDGQNFLSAGLLRLNSFTGPRDLAACSWVFPGDAPKPGDFLIAVTDAALVTPDLDEINIRPFPIVRADRVECPGQLPSGLTTSTTTTTTTSLPVGSTTTIPLTSTTLIATGDLCGSPTGNPDGPLAGDALFVLRAAVGLVGCADCLCDVDSNGRVATSDALRVLQAAVGNGGDLSCPPCM